MSVQTTVRLLDVEMESSPRLYTDLKNVMMEMNLIMMDVFNVSLLDVEMEWSIKGWRNVMMEIKMIETNVRLTVV